MVLAYNLILNFCKFFVKSLRRSNLIINTLYARHTLTNIFRNPVNSVVYNAGGDLDSTRILSICVACPRLPSPHIFDTLLSSLIVSDIIGSTKWNPSGSAQRSNTSSAKLFTLSESLFFTSPKTRTAFPSSFNTLFISSNVLFIKSKYLLTDSVKINCLSVSSPVRFRNHNLIQLNWPYRITLRYGGDVTMRFIDLSSIFDMLLPS